MSDERYVLRPDEVARLEKEPPLLTYEQLEAKVEELEGERDEWKMKNNAAVGLLNKLGERCQRLDAELESTQAMYRLAVRGGE